METTPRMPDDPVLMLAVMIERIQRGQVRVRRHGMYQQPARGVSTEFELAMTFEALPEPLRSSVSEGPVMSNDAIASMVNTSKRATLAEILDEVKEFRKWRESVADDRRYAGLTADAKVPIMNATQARELLRNNSAAAMDDTTIQAIREAIAREDQSIRKSIERADKDKAKSEYDREREFALFGTGAREQPMPEFPDDDWSGDSPQRPPKPTQTAADRFLERERRTFRKSMGLAEQSDPGEPTTAPPKRDLILD